MDKNEFGEKIQSLLNAETLNLTEIFPLITEALAENAKQASQAFATLTEEIVKRSDFAAAVACVTFFDAHSESLKNIDLPMMREVVRRAASTTEEKLFVDSVGLNSATAAALSRRLGVLVALQPGVYVNSQSWGFGCVQSIDSFYGKVIIDFEGKKGHAMSLAVAGQNLSIAADDHLMTRFLRNREEIAAMAEKHPAELVRLALRSYGPLPVQRLADVLAVPGLVPTAKWKSFWESARRALKSDKKNPIDIPTKRNEPIRLLEKEEDYGSEWLKRFARIRDIKAIYDAVIEFLDVKKITFGDEGPVGLPDSHRDTFARRLRFALKGALGTDYPRFAQIAVLMRKLHLSTPEEQAKQAAILVDSEDQDNLLLAMRGLSARDVSAMVAFIRTIRPEAKPILLSHISRLNSVALGATLNALADDADTGIAVREILSLKEPVPTVVVWALRNYKSESDANVRKTSRRAAADESTVAKETVEAWSLPSFNNLVTQAVHVVEQRLSGEDLKMRNALQAFFDSARWLEEASKRLTDFERQVLFERIQASTSWDTASQRNILVRMIRFDPKLSKLRRQVKEQKAHAHLTSLRSLTAFQLAYDHLVNVDMPANIKDISTARSYGDLRENAEYQYAKDHQNVLHSKQDEMDRTLRDLKATDFANVSTDAVNPGTTVTVSTADGELTYTILGELDRDEELNIISCRSRLAVSLIGHKVNDHVELPGEKKAMAATITAIEPLDDRIKAWLADIPTVFEPNA